MSETEPATGVPGIVSTDVHGFPTRRLGAARDALRDAHRRLVKAAAKSGQDAPIEPQIVVTREGWASRCTECACECDGAHQERIHGPGDAQVEILWPAIRLVP